MRRKYVVILLVVALPVVGGVLGRVSAPVFARAHYVVRLADRLRLEAKQPGVGRTLDSDAFRATGRKREELYAEARAVEKEFALGAAIFGLWCGLVFALRLFGLHRSRRREIYEINSDTCLSCARCFLSCPRERVRLDELAGKRTGAPVKKSG